MTLIPFNRLRTIQLADTPSRMVLVCSMVFFCSLLIGVVSPALVLSNTSGGVMTEERALELAEQFGVDVGEVDEEIREFLGLTRAEGVVIFAVIGGTPADLAGVKVKAIIKEVDRFEIKNLIDLGVALEATLPTQNFTVATYEPSDPSDQGVTGGLNFHFVRIKQD